MNLSIVIIYFALLIIDLIGYSFKTSRNERFSKYHLRKIPFLWIFFS